MGIQASGGTAQVVGTLTSTPNTTFTLEFFANAVADPSGFGEGQTFLAAASVTTDASGIAQFAVDLAVSLPASEQVVTATATDPNADTSAFSNDVTPQSSAVSGEVFADSNGNGVLDPGETGLADWTVQLINSANQTTATTTGAGGNYAFLNVAPGAYTVEEVAKPGYAETTSPTTDSIGVTAGQLTRNVNFGNQPEALSVTGSPLSATEGHTFSGTVATFADADQNGTPSDYRVTVDWGDESALTTVSGSQLTLANGIFTVPSVHVYAEEGTYTLSVAISDVDGATAAAHSVATVIDVSVHPTAVAISATAGVSETVRVATFTDPGGAEASGDYRATIFWGDGNASGGAISDPDGEGVFTVSGVITYATAGTYTARVTVTHEAAPTAAVSTAATVINGGTVGGTIYNDVNDDGLNPDGSPKADDTPLSSGLQLFTIDLVSANGDVTQTTQDTSGTYTFTGVPPGNYTIREDALPAGWIQTNSPAIYTIAVHAGQSMAAQNFADNLHVPGAVPSTLYAAAPGGLISDIYLADLAGKLHETIYLTSPTYDLTSAQNRTANGPNGLPVITAYNLTITSTLNGGSTIERGGKTPFRVFEIGGSNATLKLQNVTIEGGHAIGPDPTRAARGGGMLIDGGAVTLSNAVVSGNHASGASGTDGANGASGRTGQNGGAGGAAQGGGIYLASGALTLKGSTVSGNSAAGGRGGAGGAGSHVVTAYAPTANSRGTGAAGQDGAQGGPAGGGGKDGGDGANGKNGAKPASLKNAKGGKGGKGGDAEGGGIYMASGKLTISNDTTISNNSVKGGSGGDGGAPGRHVSSQSGAPVFQSGGFAGWPGGHGGNGGGGGYGGSHGGNGGNGGKGGMAGTAGKGGDGASGGGGGKGGDGGAADGAGLYIGSGTLAVVSTDITSNTARGGMGGRGANGGGGGNGGNGGNDGVVTRSGVSLGGFGGGGGPGGGADSLFRTANKPGPGGDAGNGGAGGDGGDGADGGNGGDGGEGGAANGGGVYIADGTVTFVRTSLDSNFLTGGIGGKGGNGGKGGAGRNGGNGGPGGFGGSGGPWIGEGPPPNGAAGAQGGNGGNGGDGGKGGIGGDPGDGANGGDAQGGGIYLAKGTVAVVRSGFNMSSAVGGVGGNGGSGGPGGNAGNGGDGGGRSRRPISTRPLYFMDGGAGTSTWHQPSFPQAAGGHGGNGGDGGNGGSAGNGGRAGHAGAGGNGEGGDIYVASGFLSINGASLNGDAQGGRAGTVGALGAAGKGGAGGQGGRAGLGGIGIPPGAGGKDGEDGGGGPNGNAGTASGPASDGISNGPTVYGASSVDTKPPATMLNAGNVTSANAGGLTPYTFTIAYSDPVLIDAITMAGAVVDVQPPTGAAITATVVKTALSGLEDTEGDAQTITVTYRMTPPGGAWTSAPGGNYTVNLVSSPPIDLASNPAATGALGGFTVNLSSVLPTSSVAALPATETSASFTVSWSGSDAGGRGVASYSVYVSDNGGPFTAFQTDTAATSATFTGVNGHTYGFYSVATDTAGDVQTTPTAAQATTTVSVVTALPTSSVNALPATETSASFTVSWSGSDPGGPGIAGYSVYVSDNGGSFTAFETNTTATSATFTGVNGHTYGFYSLATDTAGNVQSTPTAAQATTKISVPIVLPTSSVEALPATEPSTSFTVSWSGSDTGGPGIATYSVYVSDNGGPFTAFQTNTNTTATTATFTGVNAHTYGFYSVATDTAGNVQPTPAAAQATTKIVPVISATALTITGVEGTALSGAVATVTDSDSADTLAATITWPDGTTLPGTISGPDASGVFTVSGSHTFAEETSGAAVSVAISDTGGATATAASTADIAEAPLSGTSASIATGTSVSGAVASFSDADANDATGDYAATIDWGDGQTSAGSIAAGAAAGEFNVTGNHAYSDNFPHTIGVTVTHGTDQPLVVKSVEPGQTLNVLGSFGLVEDIYVVGSGTVTVAAANGVLANDTASGSLTVTTATVTGANGGTFVFHTDGSFTYTPPAKLPGFDYAQYTASDAQGDHASATINVLSQTGGVVWKFYESVLGRDPDYGGLKYWINDFATGGKTGDIAAGFFESDELLNAILGGYYEQYLGRALDAAGLDYWKGVWHATGGPEGIKAGFAASPEFNKNAGNANGDNPVGWLTALYQRILNRAPDAEGLQYWRQQLAGGTPEYNVALGFFESLEAYKNDVTGWLEEYLGRAPSGAELTQYATEMEAGQSDRQIEQQITNLPEYGQNPPASPAGTAARLPDYYRQPAATNNQQASIAAKDALFASLGG